MVQQSLKVVFVIKNKYKLKFEKIGRVRFIGHLDLMTVFQRSIIRAGIPIAFSQGFNPHQLMSFGLPLPLGMASIGEYIDIELTEEVEPKIIMKKLNDTLPKGIKILQVVKTPQGEKNSASLLTAGIYKVENMNIPNISQVVHNFIKQENIVVEKTTKKSTKEVDIKPNIYDIKGTGNAILMVISTGSAANIKPNLIVDAIYDFAKVDKSQSLKYTRVDMLKLVDGKLVPILN